jgi:hypothetical protein
MPHAIPVVPRIHVVTKVRHAISSPIEWKLKKMNIYMTSIPTLLNPLSTHRFYAAISEYHNDFSIN